MKMKDLALAQVRRGERFTLDGVEFVKLEDDMDAAFAVAADTLPECCQFEDDDAEREDHNNYAGSLLSKTVERWLRDKHPAIFSAVVERPIDLTTMDGMTDYGKPLAVVRGLTIDEYRKHRSILPLTSKPYWLATGWTTNSSPSSSDSAAYGILTDGTVGVVDVYYAYFAPRPALYLKSSILVSVETEDEGKALADYSDTDLIDELYRRRRSTYDPDWTAEAAAAPSQGRDAESRLPGAGPSGRGCCVRLERASTRAGDTRGHRAGDGNGAPGGDTRAGTHHAGV